jgi:hypothetical protein
VSHAITIGIQNYHTAQSGKFSMSRIVSAKELDLIERVISEHPEGIGISALHKALIGHLSDINRRTLQRRLKKLQEERRIIAEGESIARVYKATPELADDKVLPSFNTNQEIPDYIPLSKEGKIICDLLRQPLTKRKPVGYQRSFLEDYQPGVTFYLSKSLRSQLREIGSIHAEKRPAGTYAREILGRLLIDLSWSSSRLEGNTYSRLDTEKLIEFGQTAKGKDLQETQMILNHKAAIEMIVQEAELVGFNMFTFLNLHAILSENLLPDEDASGRLRRRPVDISGSIFHPLVMPQAVEDCFRLLLRKAAAIQDPFEQSFFVMVQLPYLQPFEDVNKRTSRLGANIPLIRGNLCPLSFIDMPEQAYIDGTLGVYEFNQTDLLCDVFTWAYERSCQRYLAITQTMAEPDPLRIKYREQLISGVQKIVRDCKAVSADSINQLTDDLVPEKDREAFHKILTDTLHRLHEGNVVRYRLKLSEFQKWKQNRDDGHF